MVSGTGWFSDIDRDARVGFQWQPCLETGGGHVPSFQVWFATKKECDRWIATYVIGAGWCPDLGPLGRAEVRLDWCPECEEPTAIEDEFDDQSGFEERAVDVRVIALGCGHSISWPLRGRR